jgi:hypothetical protein
MYTKYNALNLTNYKISIQAKADHAQTNKTKQKQEKIYTINIVTKKEVCVTPLPISLYQNMDTIHNATAERLRKDPVNDQALVKFKNQVITMNGNTKTAKEYSLFEQYQHLRRCSINEGTIAHQYDLKQEEIESEAAADVGGGVNDLEVAKTKTEGFAQLELKTNEIHFDQGIIFNAEVYAILATLLAYEIAVENEIRQDEVQEGKGFWVKFSEMPFDEMDKETARVVFNKLYNHFGPVATNRFLFNATKKELSVCFESLEAKKKTQTQCQE